MPTATKIVPRDKAIPLADRGMRKISSKILIRSVQCPFGYCISNKPELSATSQTTDVTGAHDREHTASHRKLMARADLIQAYHYLHTLACRTKQNATFNIT